MEDDIDDDYYDEYGDYDSEYDSLYDDEDDYFYGDEDDDYLDEEKEEDIGRSTGLDYYYDDQGFAHPVRPKSKFGYQRYHDAYKYHLDPRTNDELDSEYDSADDYYTSSSEDEFYDKAYGHKPTHRRASDGHKKP